MPGYTAYRVAEVLGAVDPQRSLAQFREWLEADPADLQLRKLAAASLDAVNTAEAMELAISLLSAPEVGEVAFRSVRSMVVNGDPYLRMRAPSQKHRVVWEIANQNWRQHLRPRIFPKKPAARIGGWSRPNWEIKEAAISLANQCPRTALSVTQVTISSASSFRKQFPIHALARCQWHPNFSPTSQSATDCLS